MELDMDMDTDRYICYDGIMYIGWCLLQVTTYFSYLAKSLKN